EKGDYPFLTRDEMAGNQVIVAGKQPVLGELSGSVLPDAVESLRANEVFLEVADQQFVKGGAARLGAVHEYHAGAVRSAQSGNGMSSPFWARGYSWLNSSDASSARLKAE